MAGALSAIVGLGKSALSRTPVGSPRELAVTAVKAAIGDAGLVAGEVDGLLLSQSALAPAGTLPLQMMDDIGLADLRLLSLVEGKGASVLQMVQQATLAIRHGMASYVACVFADAPIGASKGGAQSYQNESPMTGVAGWEGRYGLYGPAGSYAIAARRYMHDFGVDEAGLGEIALASRRWAGLNPEAFLREPLSISDYLGARYIAEPFRLFDCAYPVNGAIAVIVAGAGRATGFPRPPVFVHGMGQGHRTLPRLAVADENATAGALAAQAALQMAGIAPADITVCEFYDAFSYCTIAALEDCGLCERGAAVDLIASGATSPGGRLPVNTGGGQLAGYYLQGMTPLAEAVVQGRGTGGARQVPHNDLILVNGSGGRLEYHAAVVLSPHRELG